EPPVPPPVIVVPVFNDWTSLQTLVGGLAAATAGGVRPRLVIVDDGSSEPSAGLDILGRTGLAGEVLHLHRNLGHQGAIAVGLCQAGGGGDAGVIAVMDGAGEDRPEALPRLLAALEGDPARIAVAERPRRHAGLGFRMFYQLYRVL